MRISPMASLGRILVVDDDAATCDLLGMVLSEEGYAVVCAANGQAALDYLATAQPQLILLDLRMPVMGGQDFIPIYRARPGQQAPIVIMSAAFKAEAIACALQVDGCLCKPFDIQDLVACVSRHRASL
jgi:CheY-like chemotaxis protein